MRCSGSSGACCCAQAQNTGAITVGGEFLSCVLPILYPVAQAREVVKIYVHLRNFLFLGDGPHLLGRGVSARWPKLRGGELAEGARPEISAARAAVEGCKATTKVRNYLTDVPFFAEHSASVAGGPTDVMEHKNHAYRSPGRRSCTLQPPGSAQNPNKGKSDTAPGRNDGTPGQQQTTPGQAKDLAPGRNQGTDPGSAKNINPGSTQRKTK